MKYGAGHPFADPEAAARKLVESPGSIEPMQNGRIFFGIINGPFLCGASGTGRNFRTGLTFAVERDWIKRHESCTHVRLTGCGRNWVSTTCRARNKALSLSVASLEPTDLELIASFSRIGWAKSIIDGHWKDDDHDGRQFGSHAHTSERHPSPQKTAEKKAHRTRAAVRLQTSVGGRVRTRKLASGEFSNGVHRELQADDFSLLAGTVMSITADYAHRSAAMAPTSASSYIS